MKPLLPATLLPILMLILLNTQAQQTRVFTSYEAFYATLPDRLFTGSGEEIAVSPRHEVRIDGGQYPLRRAQAFPGESVYAEDLGRTATLYRSARHYCVDGIGATSGTGSRHIAVYLIERKNGRAYKLPSLFGACLGIGRHAAGGLNFLQAVIVNYRSAYDADGVAFNEHLLSGGAFSDGKVQREVHFVESGNFYRFRQVK